MKRDILRESKEKSMEILRIVDMEGAESQVDYEIAGTAMTMALFAMN